MKDSQSSVKTSYVFIWFFNFQNQFLILVFQLLKTSFFTFISESLQSRGGNKNHCHSLKKAMREALQRAKILSRLTFDGRDKVEQIMEQSGATYRGQESGVSPYYKSKVANMKALWLKPESDESITKIDKLVEEFQYDGGLKISDPDIYYFHYSAKLQEIKNEVYSKFVNSINNDGGITIKLLDYLRDSFSNYHLIYVNDFKISDETTVDQQRIDYEIVKLEVCNLRAARAQKIFEQIVLPKSLPPTPSNPAASPPPQ
jgi:hypothetical protein